MKPNFFIVGAPKAGTTSLYYYLEEHPDIYMSPIKETNFFSYDEIKQQQLFYNEEFITTEQQYLDLFRDATTEKAIGEASVSYLFYHGVPEKIHAYNPLAKIIIALRNPIDRGFSHYLMDKRLGLVKASFNDVVYKKGLHKAALLYFQQYVSLGLYYEQVKRYIEVFGREQVKILYFDDIVNNLPAIIKELYAFLEVNDNYVPDTEKVHNSFENPNNGFIHLLYTQKKMRQFIKNAMPAKFQHKLKTAFFSKDDRPVIEPGLKKDLVSLYEEDIYKTSSLLDKDLSGWLAL